MTHDHISVVMITRDRAEQVGTALHHLLDLPEAPHIIVVDNGSSDGTVNVARHLDPAIEVVPAGRNLGGAGRNLGVEIASTSYVAFSDDDSCGSIRHALHLAHRFCLCERRILPSWSCRCHRRPALGAARP